MKKFNRKKYMKKWRKKNRNKINKYWKKYKFINKDKINKYLRNYYEKNRIKLNKYARKYQKLNPKKIKKIHNKSNKKYEKKYPFKKIAQNIAHRNIKIPKNQLCETCNKRKAKHKHHEDYNKPLDIKFLCIKCHRELHRKIY
jgi:hypothetical protein